MHSIAFFAVLSTARAQLLLRWLRIRV